MEAEFSLIDVFSDRPFGGNQLAVFPRAEGLSDEVMQKLAREFNFAESTFVLPSSDPACTHRVRIFTPRTELPFAGHPTVGTAAVLAGREPRQFPVPVRGRHPPLRREIHRRRWRTRREEGAANREVRTGKPRPIRVLGHVETYAGHASIQVTAELYGRSGRHAAAQIDRDVANLPVEYS